MLDYFKEIALEKVIFEDGRESIDYPYLATYWTDEKRMPFFICKDQQTIGFVLVNDWILDKAFAAERSIAEFYVAPSFRRKSVGKKAVHALFSKYKGKWEVKQYAENTPAVAFWRSSIAEFTEGNFQEVSVSNKGEAEIVQLFTT